MVQTPHQKFCNSRKTSRLFPIRGLLSQTFYLEKSFIGGKKESKTCFVLCFGTLAVIVIQITDVDYTEHGSCKDFEKVKTLKSFRPQD